MFSGAGGLDLAVEQVLGGRVAWHAETDPDAARVLAHHWPGVPNLGDVTRVDWSAVEPVDVLAAGFPCQDVSLAGARAGLAAGTRSGLWAEVVAAVDALRPRWVVLENVRGLFSATANRNVEPGDGHVGDGAGRPVLRAAGAVLGDLADCGYDAQWVTVAAAAIGAPHLRQRVFILAHAAGAASDGRDAWRAGPAGLLGRPDAAIGGACAVELLPTPTARDHKGHNQRGDDTCLTGALLGTPSVADAGGSHRTRGGDRSGEQLLPGQAVEMAATGWGKYAAAVRRWEALTRPAPPPTEASPTTGIPQLSPKFVEWMMGWPGGWITDPAIGIRGATGSPAAIRNSQLRIAGNGVVPQQATAALRWLLWVAQQP